MTIPNTKFVLVAEEVNDDGSWLYWSNTDGWVDKDSATIFNEAEMEAFTEPQGSFGWSVIV